MGMTDRPILFSAPMVRALLDGRKTMTRRVLRLPTKTLSGGPIYERKDMGGWEPTTNGGGGSFTVARDGSRVLSRETVGIWHRTTGVCLDVPYQVGDRLYVREAWRSEVAYDDLSPAAMGGEEPLRYEADGSHQTWGYPAMSKVGRLRQGIHMPRWASRLTLTVTDVRVQRLQDISEADAIAEGIVWQEPTAEDRAWALARASDGEGDGSIEGVWLAPGTRQGYGARPNAPKWGGTPEFAFRLLWDSLNADRGFGWETNPWVVALTFTVEKRNIAEPSHV